MEEKSCENKQTATRTATKMDLFVCICRVLCTSYHQLASTRTFSNVPQIAYWINKRCGSFRLLVLVRCTFMYKQGKFIKTTTTTTLNNTLKN